jgi:hypothetical protein
MCTLWLVVPRSLRVSGWLILLFFLCGCKSLQLNFFCVVMFPGSILILLIYCNFFGLITWARILWICLDLLYWFHLYFINLCSDFCYFWLLTHFRFDWYLLFQIVKLYYLVIYLGCDLKFRYVELYVFLIVLISIHFIYLDVLCFYFHLVS